RRELGKQTGDERRPGTQERLRGFRRQLPQAIVERLEEGQIGRGASGVAGAPAKHPRPAQRRVLAQLLRQARLADPRLAREGERAAAARDRLLERRLELAELRFPSDESRAGERLQEPGRSWHLFSARRVALELIEHLRRRRRTVLADLRQQ